MSPADVFWHSIVAGASARYPAGHARRFARAKLRGDRVFRHVLEHALVPPGAAVLDVGCGQGLLAAVLAEAEARASAWPATWAPPPLGARVTGIDRRDVDLQRAQAALGDAASWVAADMRAARLPRCDVAVFLDTLHYLAPAEQEDMLARTHAALRGRGPLLLRVHHGSLRWRTRLGLAVDRATQLLRGGGAARVHGRTPEAWQALLEDKGFAAESRRLDGRWPFANRLYVARVARPSLPAMMAST